MTTQISSTKNPLIKELVALQSKARERKKKKLIVIEGRKEISLAVNSKIKIEKILYCPTLIPLNELQELIGKQFEDTEKYELTEEVFAKISYRESTGGVVILAQRPHNTLDDLKLSEQSVFIILESVEKPGNLGAICRVADAAKVDGLIICDEHTDIFNPNAIRSSLGCVFSVAPVVSDYEETSEWLKKNKITSYAAELRASEFYHKENLSGKIALIFGTEASGLTEKWIHNSDKRIKIPMQGCIDSLNVTSSVAIIVFEAMRQRDFQ